MSNLTFDGQREGEVVEFVFRRSVRTARKGVLWLIICVVLGVAPMVMWPGQVVMLYVFFGAVGIGVLGMIYAHVLWYFSVYIVTDERIRQIRQKGLFKKTMIDIWLDKIESVSFQRAGIANNGTIMIQTVAGDLTISKIPHPEEIYNRLQDVIGKVGKDEEN